MKMLNIGQVAERLGMGKSTVYKMSRDGLFPAGKKAGRAMRWPDYVVDGYMIMLYDLPEPIPQMSDISRAEIKRCISAYKKNAQSYVACNTSATQ